jgi:hypothetical protein
MIKLLLAVNLKTVSCSPQQIKLKIGDLDGAQTVTGHTGALSSDMLPTHETKNRKTSKKILL